MLKLYRYESFWLIKPKACTNQKVVRDTSCLTEIKASRSAFLVAKSAKSAKYRVFCGLRGPLGLKGWALGRLRLKQLKTGPGPF